MTAASDKVYDVIIVGGGPAGLNAAVVLGRCRREVLLFDTAKQRNRRSHGMHNYLTRDDILPMDFIQLAHKEIAKYGVTLIPAGVKHAEKNADGIFVTRDENEVIYYSKKILLATGLSDTLPDIPGFEDFYGKSVFHCPYCDGWEVRDKKIGLYARDKNGFELALSLLTWSKTVTYFSDGKNILTASQLKKLRQHGIEVIRTSVERLEGHGSQLKNVRLQNQGLVACDALFFVNGYTQQCDIVESLGCTLNNKRAVLVNRRQQSNMPGVYVAGDACKDMHFVVVAAGEGAKAGVNINKELQSEELAAFIPRDHNF